MFWYLPDKLGTTRAIVASAGDIETTIVYSAFGVIQAPSDLSWESLYVYRSGEHRFFWTLRI